MIYELTLINLEDKNTICIPSSIINFIQENHVELYYFSAQITLVDEEYNTRAKTRPCDSEDILNIIKCLKRYHYNTTRSILWFNEDVESL